MAELDCIRLENYIGGQFIPCERYIDSINPATGRVNAQVPDSSDADVDRAVQAAKYAFKSWSVSSIDDRVQLLTRLADIIEKKFAEFAIAESEDTGKPVWLAENIDIPRCVTNLRYFSTAIQHETAPSEVRTGVDALDYVQHAPVGVAALISPWNFPLYLLTWKIAPCIAYGNSCVCKPSEVTSVTAWMFCHVLDEAGCPPGLVNMCFGRGPTAGEALITHRDVRMISFTGSTSVGRHVLRTAAGDNLKKVSAELGGKNAAVVFNDADLSKCLLQTVRSGYANQGQVCLCTSRIFVQRAIYPEFLRRFTDAVRAIKVGPPENRSSVMGALASKAHYDKVQSFVEIAKQEGATFLTGGPGEDTLNLPERNKNGYFMRPVILTDLSAESRCLNEEIFGPITCVVLFDSEDEVVERVNSTSYGLCATLWCENISRVHRVAQKLNVGLVWVNCWLLRNLSMPFGGVKNSGIGREGGLDSVDLFTDKKTITIKL